MVLSILADEDVERMVVTALRENGYEVTFARERYGPGTTDDHLLSEARDRGEVILTHDTDFAALAHDRDHGGILILSSHSPDPGVVSRGVNRLTSIHTEDEIVGQVLWIEDWA